MANALYNHFIFHHAVKNHIRLGDCNNAPLRGPLGCLTGKGLSNQKIDNRLNATLDPKGTLRVSFVNVV
jgi:hypothetical protein